MYYKEHRESILRKVKAYRESHKEQIREYKKRYEQTYVRDIERTRALERARYNPEKRREKHLANKEKQGAIRAEKKEEKQINKIKIEEAKRMEIHERNKLKWLEHEKREQLKAELKKIRTEVTYEHEGKLYYNFYILRRIKSSLQSRESSVSTESFSGATP
jgi:uncharacterized protein YpuA (DUF1002 family)